MLELARHPDQLQKLREELTPYVLDSNIDILHHNIAKLDHLNGIIYETLRLYPPVPTALQRRTPPEGLEIGRVYIPGNMTVWCPQYAIGRSKCLGHEHHDRPHLFWNANVVLIEEEIYTHANEFIPER